MHQLLSYQYPSGTCQVPWKEMLEVDERKVTNALLGFRPGPSTMDQMLPYSKSFRNRGIRKKSMYGLLIVKRHLILYPETCFGRFVAVWHRWPVSNCY